MVGVPAPKGLVLCTGRRRYTCGGGLVSTPLPLLGLVTGILRVWVTNPRVLALRVNNEVAPHGLENCTL